MPVFKFAKLVRDNVWQWHIDAGHVIKGEQLTAKQLRKSLCAKLHEEADEMDGALSREELIEEIADVRQILDDLCEEAKITNEDVARVQHEKLNRKGGFRGGRYIETLSIPGENDKWSVYCRARPDKYPEVDSNGHASSDLPSVDPGTYRHNKKGQLYEVIGTGLHTETSEPMVLYRPLYKNKYKYFVRPYAGFTETVSVDGKVVPRFEKQSE